MVKKVGAKAVALGAVVAAGAGYIAGILTAPKSGKKTRKDIAKKANKTMADAERQLKKSQAELNDLIKEGDARTKKARTKVNKELSEALKKAKVSKDKSKQILNALRDGETEDPNLQAAVEEIKLAKTNLAKYLKK